jgi:predicted 3-demethylubiquinone-9 3-methyltransferase (glyoxalase superfamily)
MQGIKPFIWFTGQAEEAMNYYVGTFPNSKISHIERYSGDQGIPDEDKLKGKVLTGVFELNGTEFMCLDGGPQFEVSGGISFVVEPDTQEEIDKIWARLADGGKEIQCGWVTDKFGITWQVVPKQMGEMMSSGTPAQKQAVMKAMMPMVKMDIAKLEEAYEATK